MPSSYSTNLRLQLMATGENRSTWGVKANEVFTDLDAAVAGLATIVIPSDANYTLTTSNGSPDEARYMGLNLTSSTTLTATRSVIVPSVSKFYVVTNATTGGQTINVRTSTNTTQALVATGQTAIVWCDGSVCTTQIMPGYASRTTANTFSALQTVMISTATTTQEYAQWRPTNHGTGNPYVYLQKTATASRWQFGLWDGTDNTGTIDFAALTGLTWNGVQLTSNTGTQTLTNKTLTTPAISGAALSGTFSGNPTYTGPHLHTVTNSTTIGDYIVLRPTDYGTGKPGIFFNKSSTATTWNITLYDGVDTTGTININSSILTHNAIPIANTTGTQTLTNKTLTSPAINTPIINTATINTPTITSPVITGGATMDTYDVSGMLKISTTTLINAFTTVSLPSGFRQFKIVIQNAASTLAATTDTLSITASINAGSSFYNTSGDYTNLSSNPFAAFGTCDITGGTPVLKGGNAEFLLNNAGGTGYQSLVAATSGWRFGGSGNVGDASVTSRVLTATGSTVNALRFICGSSLFSNSGTVTIYGLKL